MVRRDFVLNWRSLRRAAALIRQADALLGSAAVRADDRVLFTVEIEGGRRSSALIPYRPWSAYPVPPVETDWTDAEPYLDRAALILQQTQPSRRTDRVWADCQESQGIFCHRVGRWREAEEYFQSALKIFKKNGRTSEEAQCLRHLASLYYQTGKWSDAENALRMSLPDPVSVGDPASVGTLISMGNLFARRRRNQDAERFYRRALELCPRKKLMTQRAEALAGLGKLLADMKRFAEALEALHSALQIELGDFGTQSGAAFVHQGLADVQRMQGRMDLAVSHLMQSNLMFRQARISAYVAMSNYELSSFRLSRMETAAAVQLYDEAFSGYSRLGKYQSAARIALRRAHDLIELSAPDRNGLIDESIHLALPAFLHLDRVRFQFNASSDRQSWARFVEWAASLTFKIAVLTEDPQLLSDLIETRINSAAHTATTRSGGNSPAAPSNGDYSVEDTLLAAGESHRSLIAAGTTRLLAGTSLPAQPGPLLLVPRSRSTRRVALEHFYQVSPYPQTGLIQRPVSIC